MATGGPSVQWSHGMSYMYSQPVLVSGKIHAMLFALRTWIFWEWIPSKSNWADEISREGVRDTFGRRNRFHLFRARCPHELWPLPLRALLQVTEFL